MGKVISSTFVSLDGVINHMERWHFSFIDDESDSFALQQLLDSDALLMGRHTYDAYAGAWPGRDGKYADRINAMPKYVASTTLKTPTWTNTSLIDRELVAAVSALKEGNRTILMHGYGPVAKTLVRHGLLDELALWVNPQMAGVGTYGDMLFSEGLNTRFTLLDVKPFPSGVVVLTYRPSSELA